MSYILQLQLQHARSLQPRSEAHVTSEYEEHRADAHEEPWELASQHGYGVASNIAGWWFGTLLILVNHKYCRASHTGDAGRGRGRERERGMSSELANMTC